ncbi:ABC transporter transmembrane domain-containing protein [Alkalicoccus halolimnae]|uniref:ABC transporter transmembrane domain-containing protein n=1 Tax=Alkalicoccus halolimnae TaxID=1667239 RepID=A0A5C7FRF1_9BACI|nr:ABC transporter transmembrane domain-containing protein [Alkalicoccus halolimnae]TXF87295.1 ATP-binding cassette domain-containing protein [Alkalicoccus halolimnae]
MKVFMDLAWYFKQEKVRYGTGVIILMLVSALTLIPPYVIGIIVDSIANETLTPDDLTLWMGILLIIGISSYIFRYIWRILIFGASIKLARILRNRLYKHFTAMSSSFFQKKRTGDLMAHATNDIRAIEQTAGAGVLTLVDSLTMGGYVIITMAAVISWELTLIALIPMPLMAFATSKYGSLLHQRFGKAQAAFSSLNDKVQESISGVKVTKTFGYEEKEIESFREQSDDVVNKNMAVARVDALFDPTISLVVGMSFFLSVAFGSLYVIDGEITIGQLTSFTVYLGLLIWPMLAFGWFFNIVERGRASNDRVSSLLRAKQEITDDPDASSEMPEGEIMFAIDLFSYSGAEDLKNVEIFIPTGATLGVAGRTGSGKTTLVQSLLRDFDITEGTVYIDGHPITRYKKNALLSAVAYVPQDHFLFSATIADNIAFGLPEASYKDIIQAAKAAAVHEDISRFPQGYETIVGERGVTLSGGQKQRVSIARALLLNPQILILDDSLSAVDARTEEFILNSLREARKNKTTIITAHRLSALHHADEIVVMDNGSISERGTHRFLMSESGWYAEMYQTQQLEKELEGGKGDA